MSNINKIIEACADKIDNSTTTEELLYLSKAIEKLKVGNVKLANNVIDIYDGVSSFGELYFVESDNSLYFSNAKSRILLLSLGTSAYAWGAGTTGRLGDNTAITKSSPVSVVGGFTNWIQVSARNHSLGIRANGTAWAWGPNTSGRLGDGTVTTRSSPVSVVGGFTDWVQVSAGTHSLGVRSNGSAWAWGSNISGELGDGTMTSRSSPVSVIGGFTDWIQVSAYGSSLGLRSNGTVWAWGTNSNGQLGDGTAIDKSSPVSVIGGFTDWIQVSAGANHSIALRSNGTIWAWGYNTFGRLGDGTTTSRSSPVSVVGGFTDWVQVSAGNAHNLGLRANGTAWAWGYNAGRLGDNTTISRLSPVSVVGGFTDWIQVDAGGSHSLGVRSNGTAWAWGTNTSGQLGDGTATTQSSPVSVVGGFTDWIQVSSGGTHSLAIRSFK